MLRPQLGSYLAVVVLVGLLVVRGWLVVPGLVPAGVPAARRGWLVAEPVQGVVLLVAEPVPVVLLAYRLARAQVFHSA